MARTIAIGPVTSKRGHYVYGTLTTMPLPSGGVESWPLIIVQGDEGPVLWLTVVPRLGPAVRFSLTYLARRVGASPFSSTQPRNVLTGIRRLFVSAPVDSSVAW